MAEDYKECDDNLDALTKEELVQRVRRLEAHIKQLQNVLGKQSGKNTIDVVKPSKRPFQFEKHNKRHVALKVAYFGWNYQGFVVQEDTMKTIESELFDALLKTRLIESRETSNYHRCGRTDKGVSAFCQVISVDVRSKLANCADGNDTADELRYIYILNKVLPPEIRVLAWAAVEPTFSARFDCRMRTYKYYFPKGNLNLEKMNEASKHLVGEHDFRNLCKMDVGNGVLNYVRNIYSVSIAKSLEACESNGYEIYELCIKGQAFLWHQVRCIIAILFLVARSKEDPSIVRDLLDVQKHPRKPQYTMASELPLVLFQCDFESVDWQHDDEANMCLVQHLQEEWTKQAVKATITKKLLEQVEAVKNAPRLRSQADCLSSQPQKNYKPLLSRPCCDSLEERIEHFKKRKSR